MGSISSIWNRATENRTLALGGAGGAIFIGVVLIAIGEVFDWGWTRIVGAGLISTAAVLLGALIGWAEPLRPRIASVFSSWSRTIVVLLTVIMVAPMFAGLLMLFAGAIVGGILADWPLLIVGIFVTILLLSISVGTVVAAVSLALRGLWRTGKEVPAGSNGQDSA